MIARLIDATFSAWTARKMAEHLPYPPEQTALLLVDVQKAFFERDRAGEREIRTVAERVGFKENVRGLAEACRERGIPVVHCPFRVPPKEAAPQAREIPYVRRLRQLDVAIGDDEGGEIPAGLVSEEDLVLESREVLNVFYGTDLEDELQGRGISHLIVTGSVANASVDSTGRMGVELDYDVTFVSDCIAAFDPAAHAASVEVTFPRMANRVVTSHRVRENLPDCDAPRI